MCCRFIKFVLKRILYVIVIKLVCVHSFMATLVNKSIPVKDI